MNDSDALNYLEAELREAIPELDRTLIMMRYEYDKGNIERDALINTECNIGVLKMVVDRIRMLREMKYAEDNKAIPAKESTIINRFASIIE